jgi:type II secretory pathway pseudopilin PulG
MRGRRNGITLVETLVVLGIFGLLLAILIPAVHHARESGRRVTCQNNLRQIVHGILNHESAHALLPSLYNGSPLTQPRTEADEFHFHPWRTAILAQLEKAALLDRIDQSLFATDPANQASLNIHVATFLCPSTSNPNSFVRDIFAFNDVGLPIQTVGTAARSDYEAIGGVSFKPSGTFDLQNVKFGAWGEPKSYYPFQTSNTFRTARLRDLSDGQSNTMLVAERAGRPDWYRRGKAVDPYPYSSPGTGMDHHQAAWGISTHFWWLVLLHEQSINEDNAKGIFSFHASGAHVGLADGSVRFLSESMDQATLNALATRSSGEIESFDGIRRTAQCSRVAPSGVFECGISRYGRGDRNR